MAIKISIVTPSIRPLGLKITQDCLSNQTLKDFEWLVELSPIQKEGSDLNRALNRGLRRAKGELIVFLQDYIKIKDDGLERFWNAYQENPEVAFTAPVGQTLDWKDIKWDWRKQKEGVPPYPITTKKDLPWTHWEIDWGSCPLKLLKEVGGFDEELDQFWGMDNVSLGKRLDLARYKIRNLKDNLAVAFMHDKKFKHPYRERRNPAFCDYRLKQYEMGLQLNYLK